jgi:DNA-binding NtrC family response regulator
VRELRNLVARYVALGADIEIPVARPSSFPTSRSTSVAAVGGAGDWLDSLVAQDIPFPIARRMSLEEFERRYVAAVLARHNGNVGQAAKASGLALRYFRLVRARQK